MTLAEEFNLLWKRCLACRTASRRAGVPSRARLLQEDVKNGALEHPIQVALEDLEG